MERSACSRQRRLLVHKCLDAGEKPLSEIKISPVPSARGTETILLVEDQEGIRELASELLKRNGYSVLCAGDGQEALKIAAEHDDSINLLVTDVIMPNMDGHELAHRLTRARPQTKVLFMSGNADQASLSHHLGDVPALVLQKPFRLDALLHKVRSVLDQ